MKEYIFPDLNKTKETAKGPDVTAEADESISQDGELQKALQILRGEKTDDSE